VGNSVLNILADFLTLRLIKYLLDLLNAYNFIPIRYLHIYVVIKVEEEKARVDKRSVNRLSVR